MIDFTFCYQNLLFYCDVEYYEFIIFTTLISYTYTYSYILIVYNFTTEYYKTRGIVAYFYRFINFSSLIIYNEQDNREKFSFSLIVVS